MRDIKFRAFVKFNKTMLNVENIDLKRKYVSLFSESLKPNPCDRYNLNDIEIMQYTGLLDKNGIEIYEGDVVHFNDGATCKIIWDGIGYSVSTNTWEECLMPFDNEDMEVIGNIYVNPELLDTK